jgi:hypothetical protein
VNTAFFISFTFLAAGCSFSLGHGIDLGADAGLDNGDMTVGGDDLSNSDMTMICSPRTQSCSGSTLSICNDDGTGFDTSTCKLGCNSMSTDCLALQPTPPAVASDFVYGGLSELTIAPSQTLLIFDTDTGAITDNTGATVRMPNVAADMRYVENGIGFHRTPSGVGIWTFNRLTVPATATMVFKNPYAASIVSPGDISIAGIIDLRGYLDPTKALMTLPMSTLCSGNVAGPGGGTGASGATAASGGGAGGQPDDSTAGGGGAGFGDAGGVGGNNASAKGGKVGSSTGSAAISPFAGGGFGGGSSGGNGGGGGGGLQLAAEGTITISGTINAGGCGGAAGDATHGGGGGGSGGAILIEAVNVHVTAAAILAANGGGGGAGGSATATGGDPGSASASQANGGAGLNGGHNGGSGDALGATAAAGSNGAGAGGGGGGVGRIRLNAMATPTVDAGAMISPAQTAGVIVVQ